MDARCTMGELRNLLAGLRCPVLQSLASYPDDHVVEISTSAGRLSAGVRFYALGVEIPERRRSRRRQEGGDHGD